MNASALPSTSSCLSLHDFNLDPPFHGSLLSTKEQLSHNMGPSFRNPFGVSSKNKVPLIEYKSSATDSKNAPRMSQLSTSNKPHMKIFGARLGRAIGLFRESVLPCDLQSLHFLDKGSNHSIQTYARPGTPLAMVAPGPLCVTRLREPATSERQGADLSMAIAAQCAVGDHARIRQLFAIMEFHSDRMLIEQAALGPSLDSYLVSLQSSTAQAGYSSEAPTMRIVTSNAHFVLNILMQVVSALVHMHERGVSHCDISSRKIFMRNVVPSDGKYDAAEEVPVLLGGFYNARSFEVGSSNPSISVMCAHDVFKLGCLAYEMVEGRPLRLTLPKKVKSPVTGYVNSRPCFQDGMWKRFSPAFRDMICSCIEVDHRDRPTARELESFLTGIIEERRIKRMYLLAGR